MSKTTLTWLAAAIPLFIASSMRAQGEASKYVYVAPNAQVINQQTDYFSISLVQGWISTRNRGISALLSRPSKFSVLIESAMQFDNGERRSVAFTKSNEDIAANVDKSWGANPTLLERIPGYVNPDFAIQLAIYREDNIQRVLGALEKDQAALPVQLAASPALGYAGAIGGVFRELFRTDRTRIPFTWHGSLRAQSPAIGANGEMREHYIILIAPKDPSDRTYQQLDQTKLSFDGSRLKYNNSYVTEWTFAVLYIGKVTSPSVQQLALASNEPWATLVTRFFILLPTSDAGGKDELRTLSRSVVNQLNNEIDLLRREVRFSAYTRAVAVASLGQSAADQISERCTALSVSNSECPTGDILRIVNSVRNAFGIRDQNPALWATAVSRALSEWRSIAAPVHPPTPIRP